ncbi:GNAT family N-acetyltransferase [Aliikangiella sp. IMCC44359]|uniref:GNAT family N-acetyltransferase n=1 Tax=Aliikangiella sp. IMCC44359 TaxID=3459125 RepID=UPI00403B17EB
MNSIEIQDASIDDASTILKIQREAYISEAELHNDFDIPPMTQTLDELIAEFDNKKIIKVLMNGELVASGQAKFHHGTCFIGRMAVKPEFKGKGIGSKLLACLETSYTDATRAELFTGINSLVNLGMYKRRGYSEFKQEQLGKTTVVFLEKNL